MAAYALYLAASLGWGYFAGSKDLPFSVVVFGFVGLTATYWQV